MNNLLLLFWLFDDRFFGVCCGRSFDGIFCMFIQNQLWQSLGSHSMFYYILNLSILLFIYQFSPTLAIHMYYFLERIYLPSEQINFGISSPATKDAFTLKKRTFFYFLPINGGKIRISSSIVINLYSINIDDKYYCLHCYLFVNIHFI